MIFWLAGAALLGVGIWFSVDDKALQVLHIASVDSSDAMVKAASYTIIVVGAVVFFTGFLGCCGAMKESSCMLITYATVLGLLLVLEVTAGILAAVFRNDIMDTLDKSMNKTVFEYYGEPDHTASTTAWDFTQVKFTCCGATVGPSDWANSNWRKNSSDPFPLTCCELINDDSKNPQPRDKQKCMNSESGFINSQGCKKGLESWIRSHAGILIGVAFAVAAIQIIAMVFACCLKKSIKAGYEYV